MVVDTLTRAAKGFSNPSVILGFSTLAVFLFMGRFDFDGHHDGVMLAAAIAVSEGLSMHGQVYGHYGPITPWTQSLFLNLPVSEAYALRVWIATHVALTAFFLSELGKILARQVGLSEWVGPIASMFWVLSSDSFANLRLLPWSSIQAGTLAVGFVLLLLKAVERQNQPRGGAIHLSLAAGLLMALAPFVKLNSGLALWGLIGLVLIADRALKFRWFEPRVLSAGIAGFLLGLSGVVILLVISGSLYAFIEQSVVGPLTWGADVVEDWQPISGLSRSFVGFLPGVLLFLLALALSAFFGRQNLGKAGRLALVGAQVSLLGAAFLLTSLKITLSREATTNSEIVWYLVRDFVLARGSDLHFFLFVHLVLLGVASIIFLGKVGSPLVQKSRAVPILAITAVVNVSLLAQIYPVWDGRHVWWGTPLATLLSAFIVAYIVRITHASLLPFASVVVLQAVASALTLYVAVDQNRVLAPSNTVAANLMVTPEVAATLNGYSQLLSDPSFDRTSVLFLVLDGDISVVDGHFLSRDPYFTWWSRQEKDLGDIVPGVASLVVDDYFLVTAGYDSKLAFASDWGLVLEQCAGSVCLLSSGNSSD